MPPPEQALIFATIGALLAGLFSLQRRAPYRGAYMAGLWLPRDEATVPRDEAMGKRAYEVWILGYSLVWMGSFGLIIALQLYEAFDAAAYFLVCGGLALPLWVQAFAAAVRAGRVTHALRAQAWVAVFGFIGNYWHNTTTSTNPNPNPNPNTTTSTGTTRTASTPDPDPDPDPQP